jgi:hypothetical protein
MNTIMARHGSDDEQTRPERAGAENRRWRARKNALLLALLAAAFYVGFIAFGLLRGIFPG